MSVLRRKLLKDLWQARLMALAIIAIASVGVGCFVGLLNTWRNLDSATTDYYAQARQPDAWVDLKQAPRQIRQSIEQLPAVGMVQERLSEPFLMNVTDNPAPIPGLVVSLPTAREASLAQPVLMRGNPLSGRRDEALILQAFADAHGLEPGDKLVVILNGQEAHLHIAGVVVSAEFMYTAAPGSVVPDPGGFGVLWMQERDVERWFDMAGSFNQLLLRWSVTDYELKLSAEIAIADILEQYGYHTLTHLESQSSHVALSSELMGLRIMAILMPGIFLIVTAIVMHILMSRLAEQQRNVMGSLKAIGYSEAQLARHLYSFGASIGVLGGVGGILIGALMTTALTEVYRHFFQFPSLEVRFFIGPVILAPILGAAVAAFGTRSSVKAIAALSPAAAMRPPPPPVIKEHAFERWRVFRRLPFIWQLSIRNLMRQPKRTLLSVQTAAMGTAILVMVLAMGDAVREMSSRSFTNAIRYDVALALDNYYGQKALQEVAGLPGAGLAEAVLDVPGTLIGNGQDKAVSIQGIARDAALTVALDAAGRPLPIPPAGLLLEERLAQRFQLQGGDSIAFQLSVGDRRIVQLPVAGIYNASIGLGVYADQQWLERQIGESTAINSIQVRLDDGARDAFMGAMRLRPKLQAINDAANLRAEMDKLILNKLYTIQSLMVGFAGIIFLGSILNNALVALSERRREIGTMRSLGYSRELVNGQFFRESLAVLVVAIPLGVLFGILLNLGVTSLYKTDLYSISFAMTRLTPVLAVIFGLGFAIIAQTAVARLVDRMNWVEAVRLKE